MLKLAIAGQGWGQARVANELKKKRVPISAAGVGCVWLTHDLETVKKRLKELEAKSLQEGLIVTEAQMVALARAQQDREAHGLESKCSVYCGAQDAFL